MKKYLALIVSILVLLAMSSCSMLGTSSSQDETVQEEENIDLSSAPEQNQAVEEIDIEESVAYIQEIDGDVVKITTAGKVDLEEGSFLSVWERILTLKNSEVTLVFEDDSIIRLSENTAFTVDVHTEKETSSTLNKWSVWGRILRPVGSESDFKIMADNVSATVRGTSILMEANENGELEEIQVLDSYSDEGVLVESWDDSVVLQPEEEIVIDTKSTTSTKKKLEKKRIKMDEVLREKAIVRKNTKKDIIYMQHVVEKREKAGNVDVKTVEKIQKEIKNTVPKSEEVESFFEVEELLQSLEWNETDMTVDEDIVELILKDEILKEIKKSPEKRENKELINEIIRDDFKSDTTQEVVKKARDKAEKIELKNTSKVIAAPLVDREKINIKKIEAKKEKEKAIKTEIKKEEKNVEKKEIKNVPEKKNTSANDIKALLEAQIKQEKSKQEALDRKNEILKKSETEKVVSHTSVKPKETKPEPQVKPVVTPTKVEPVKVEPTKIDSHSNNQWNSLGIINDILNDEVNKIDPNTGDVKPSWTTSNTSQVKPAIEPVKIEPVKVEPIKTEPIKVENNQVIEEEKKLEEEKEDEVNIHIINRDIAELKEQQTLFMKDIEENYKLLDFSNIGTVYEEDEKFIKEKTARLEYLKKGLLNAYNPENVEKRLDDFASMAEVEKALMLIHEHYKGLDQELPKINAEIHERRKKVGTQIDKSQLDDISTEADDAWLVQSTEVWGTDEHQSITIDITTTGKQLSDKELGLVEEDTENNETWVTEYQWETPQEEPVIKNQLFKDSSVVLEHEWNDSDGSVQLFWNSFEKREDFMYYKVVRSQNNPDPTYPEDNAIKVLSNVDATQAKDYPNEGTNYYRICVVTKHENRHCGNVIKIENDKKEEEVFEGQQLQTLDPQ